MLSPFLRWMGGKRQMLGEILPRMPMGIRTYSEPFLGGGAVFLAMKPHRAVLNDINEDLIIAWRAVKDDTESLIALLRGYENSEEAYLRARNMDREGRLSSLTPTERAARMIYINRACFGGQWRVNSDGCLNMGYGGRDAVDLVGEKGLRDVGSYLRQEDRDLFEEVSGDSIRFMCGDFADCMALLGEGDFAYIDPPYWGVGFTGYTAAGFGKEDHERLREECDRLDRRGCRFMVSNQDTPWMRTLWRGYRTDVVTARYTIPPMGSGEAAEPHTELLTMNYRV